MRENVWTNKKKCGKIIWNNLMVFCPFYEERFVKEEKRGRTDEKIKADRLDRSRIITKSFR